MPGYGNRPRKPLHPAGAAIAGGIAFSIGAFLLFAIVVGERDPDTPLIAMVVGVLMTACVAGVGLYTCVTAVAAILKPRDN